MRVEFLAHVCVAACRGSFGQRESRLQSDGSVPARFTRPRYYARNFANRDRSVGQAVPSVSHPAGQSKFHSTRSSASASTQQTAGCPAASCEMPVKFYGRCEDLPADLGHAQPLVYAVTRHRCSVGGGGTWPVESTSRVDHDTAFGLMSGTPRYYVPHQQYLADRGLNRVIRDGVRCVSSFIQQSTDKVATAERAPTVLTRLLRRAR